MRVTYISWAPHCSRSDYTARELGGTSHMVYWAWLGSHPATVLLKYIGQAFSTWRILGRERPDAVFVMSPPPVAIMAVYAYCLLARRALVIDAHTGVFLTRRWQPFLGLHFWLCRRAATTIVTNEAIAELVRSRGGAATVVPDVPVVYNGAGRTLATPKTFTAVFVTSFDRDEPIQAMADAAARLPDVTFLMTGDFEHAAQPAPAPVPANLRLTGFLDAAEYGALLREADVVIALTTDDHTMQRGAFEGIYQGTPVIVSDTAVLRQAFDAGALHVDNTAEAIAAAVQRVREAPERYREGARALRERKLQQWTLTKARLLADVERGLARQ